MVQQTISRQELEANMLGVISQMSEGQEVVVMEGQQPVARLSSVQSTADALEPVHVTYSAFEFPFP